MQTRRKIEASPNIKKMLMMNDDTELIYFTREELAVLISKARALNTETDVHKANERTSCLYFIRNHWTNKAYKGFRKNSEEMKIQLLPLDDMKKALQILMPIPQPVRCTDVENCNKCGTLSLLEMMKFELSLPDVQKNIRFFKKDMMLNCVNKLRLDSGRTFDYFIADSPTLVKRYSII